jgi:hypothetical protein
LKDANQRTVGMENGCKALHQMGPSMHHTKSHQPQPSSASLLLLLLLPVLGRYCCLCLAGTISTLLPPPSWTV